MTRYLLVGLACLLGGCLPIPHFDRVVPAITGVVTRHGVPVEGASIYLHRRFPPSAENCSASPDRVQTDATGHFAVGPDSDFRFFVTMGDPITTWTLCIEHLGTLYIGWQNFEMGYAEAKITLTCELSTTVQERGNGRGVCRR